MDSSSTPNRVTDNDNNLEDDEEQELLTPDSKGKRKESPEASGETYNAKKAPRILPAWSKIWGHFTRTKENLEKCICHYCNKKLCCATKSGTSNFLKHLTVCKHFKAFSEGKLKSAKISERTFRETTNEMMVIVELPLSFV
ncbi:hypothetical protein N665_1202s0002 [Sinapis alba]|nr:hypothetical protein N665_1202s0002 [Sinapis alba]